MGAQESEGGILASPTLICCQITVFLPEATSPVPPHGNQAQCLTLSFGLGIMILEIKSLQSILVV